jgi:hypothetical protein
MEPEVSLPRAQQRAACSYSEQYDPVQSLQSYPSKIHCNIIHHLRLDIPSCFYPSPQILECK